MNSDTEASIEKVTLDNCDREPIHIPGAIQPHGALVVFSSEALTVLQVSVNCGDYFDQEPQSLLGVPLAQILHATSLQQLQNAFVRQNWRELNPFVIRTSSGRIYDGIMHRVGELVILELETPSARNEDNFGRFYRRLHHGFGRIRDAATVNELATIASNEIRELTGFDRVMVYQFAPDGSGEVIGEAKRDGLEPFLGLHYPASDIPAQARRLYLLNWLRLIADIDYVPSQIIPPLNPQTHAPLDMSFSVLRSVSPVHIEYLRNMGVRASMSISLVADGALWGLIACHNYAPKLVSYEIRQSCEFLGEALSWQVASRQRADLSNEVSEGRRLLADLVDRMAAAAEPMQGLESSSLNLVHLVEADGVAFVRAGQYRTLGDTPPVPQIAAFAKWLAINQSPNQEFVTDALSIDFPQAPKLSSAAGVLAVPVFERDGEYVIWFRGEVRRTVNWAGEPQKNIKVEGGVPRLSPRGSFALWKETVRQRSRSWSTHHVEIALQLRNSILTGIQRRAADLSRLNQDLRATNLAKDEFLATLSHELRTPLNAMLGWLRLLASGQIPAAKQAQAIETVLRNARSQAQLVEDLLDVSRITSGKMRMDVEAVDPTEIVQSAVESAQPTADARNVRLTAILDPKAGPVLADAQRLKQIVWNLLTNAIKFTPRDGRVKIHVQRIDSVIEIAVSDNGAGISSDFLPFIFEPFRQADGAITRAHKGLGLGLAIVRKLTELHGGTVHAQSAGEGKGATFTVRLPVMSVHAKLQRARHPTTENETAAMSAFLPAPQLAGLRVLVVDDEPDASGLLFAALEPYEMEVVSAESAMQALALMISTPPDILISDIGMPDVDGYELMRRIRALPPEQGGAIPAVALTAFARTEDRAKAFLAGFDVYLPKPVDLPELIALLTNLSGRVERLEPATGAERADRNVRLLPTSEPEKIRAGSANSGLLQNIRILIVEDDEDSREMLATVLRSRGASVESAETVAQALALASSVRPDVILSDLTLPDKDGLAFLRELRAGGPDAGGWVPAIALSGHTSQEHIRQAKLAGFSMHMAKPLNAEEIAVTVARIAKRTGSRKRVSGQGDR